MVFQICDVMMSISIWDKVRLWIYFLNHNSLSHQTWPTDRYKQEKWFSGIFWSIGRTRAKFLVHFNLATCTNYSVISYVNIMKSSRTFTIHRTAGERGGYLFKACVRYFLSNFYFSPNNSPSKTMKNIFYFI